MKKAILLFIVSILISFSAYSQTIIPDNLSIGGTWTLANSPYVIEGRAIVLSGQVLTIEPGVEVRFKSSASPMPSWFDYTAGNVGVLRIEGEIIANGTVANPILFTRDNAGFWGTILIGEQASTASSISHCIIEYAKESRNVTDIPSVVSFDGGLSVYKNTLAFHDNQVRNNAFNGIAIKDLTAPFEVSLNTIYNNGSNGIVIENSSVNVINNTLFNNSITASGAVSAIRSSNSDVYLVGNLVYNNDDFGIHTLNGGSHYLVNNTIIGNSQGIRVENGANTYIINSIVQDNALNFATSNPIGATIEMQYSLTDDTSLPVNVTDIAANVFGGNALFTNSSGNDFSLQASSPAINTGNPSTAGLNLPAIDILGNTRIDEMIIDMGAIEFQHSLGVESRTVDSDVIIYPNPTTAIINVVRFGQLQIEIYGAHGRAIGKYTSKEIDLTNYESGVYIFKIEDEKGNLFIKRIIKQ